MVFPERDDFLIYMDDPEIRFKNWYKAVELAAPLGEAFLELAARGRVRNVVEKF